MKRVLIIFLTLLSLGSFGQEKKVIFGGSYSIDYLSYQKATENLNNVGILLAFKGRISHSLSANLKYKLNRSISLTSGIGYSNKKFLETFFIEEIRRVNPDDPLLGISGDLVFIHSNKFIEVPISFEYVITRHIKPQIELLNSFRIASGIKQVKGGKFIVRNPRAIEYKNYLGSFRVGIGISLPLKDFEFILKPHLVFYLQKIHTYWIVDNPIQFGVTLSVFKI